MPIDREKVLQAAQKYVEKRRFDRAIAEYQKIVQEDPTDARILLKIGDLQAKMDAYPDAIATYERVARFYASQGFSVKAIAVYKQIRELIRKHVPKLTDEYGHIIPKLAELYQQLGLTSDALSAYDEYATHLQRAGRERDAIDVFRKIVEINGNNPLTRLRLAEALLRENKSDDALVEFQTAADILLGMGRKDDALKVIERMVYHRPDTAVARKAAEMYLERGGTDDAMMALAKLQICFQADQRDLTTLDLLARAFVAIAQAPKAIEVRKEMVRIARDQGKMDLVQQLMRQLLEEAPNDETVRGLANSIFPGAPASVEASRPRHQEDALIEVSEEALDVGLDEAESLDVFESELVSSHSINPVRVAVRAPPIPTGGIGELIADPLEGLGLSPEPPASRARSVYVDESQLEAAEDFSSAPQAHDQNAHARDVVANAHAFAKVGYFAKAIETLRIGLELNPYSIELHSALRDILLQTDDIPGAVAEMLTIGAMYAEDGERDFAEAVFREVFDYDPENLQAREMLESIGCDAPPMLDATCQVPLYQELPPVEANPPSEAYGPGSWSQDSTEPLPSYDLEEINPDYIMSSVPAAQPIPAADLLSTDDPFGSFEARQANEQVDEPFGHASPLPSFPFIDEDAQPAREASLTLSDEGLNDTYAGPLSDALLPAADDFHDDDSLLAQPLAGTRAFQGGDSLEEALEEADFFASRSLFEDALAIIDEQLLRVPNHPLLKERAREIRQQWELSSGAVYSGTVGGPSTPPDEDHSFDIAASLEVIEMAEVLSGPRDTSSLANPVDVEEVFAKFKEGVKLQVSENDSETHYDLGVAYREMGLMNDAISEFELAAKDPLRECVCCCMIGMIHRETGDLETSIQSLIRGLHADRKTMDQELSIYYELGCIYELKGNPREAVYYFQKVSNRDPSFRDVAAHIRALQISAGSAPTRSPGNADDDFDQAFDDLLSDHKSI